jgi:hypothetical protein
VRLGAPGVPARLDERDETVSQLRCRPSGTPDNLMASVTYGKHKGVKGVEG